MLLCSQCCPDGLEYPSFKHYSRRVGISITIKYLITPKEFIKHSSDHNNNDIIIIY
jgi:hypothetical protein